MCPPCILKLHWAINTELPVCIWSTASCRRFCLQHVCSNRNGQLWRHFDRLTMSVISEVGNDDAVSCVWQMSQILTQFLYIVNEITVSICLRLFGRMYSSSHLIFLRSRVTALSVVTRLRARRPARDFPLLQRSPDRSWAHPTFCYMDSSDSFS